jgi:16S rRNA (guanine527-N7)-methyltransferase
MKSPTHYSYGSPLHLYGFHLASTYANNDLIDRISYNARLMILATERITQLLVPFLEESELSSQQLKDLQSYLDLLVMWNSKMNLTAIRDPEEIVTRHFGESLFAAKSLFPDRAAQSVIDVGAGAGFPGIPIKIWNGAVELTLIESNQKKAVFLREVIRALGLKHVSVEAARAEHLSVKADIVTLRAVERFEQVLPIARRLVKPRGRLALLIGDAQVQTAKIALSEIDWRNPSRIPLSSNRILLAGSA